MVFIFAMIYVIVTSVNEAPQVLFRVWIVGYAIKCCVHGYCIDGESYEDSDSESDDKNIVLNLNHEDVVHDHHDGEQT
ncbi:hypothetical protein AG4045_023334, partial [Apium graveolens]